MKIAVVGCGALGSYYGAKLCQAGHEVHFLLRSDYEVVSGEGLTIESPSGNFHIRPLCAREPEDIGPSDLVLIGLKTTANSQFPKLLPPLVGPHTLLLTLQNGLGNEEQLAQLFPPNQILGGLAFVCLNRLRPGLVRHINYGRIVIGEFQRPPAPRTYQIAELFSQAGIPCEVSPNLAQAHWEKLIWNIPFNGLGVAACAGYQAVLSGDSGRIAKPLGPCFPTDRLLADPSWAKLVEEIMFEVVHAGRALGYEISAELAAHNLAYTRAMGPYKASTLLDFEQDLPLELDSLFLEPLRQATQAGVSTPRLRALCEILQALQPR